MVKSAAGLTHGVDASDRLVPIEEAPRGRCSLRCPYCGRGLLARKGRVLTHHFAHDGDTCLESMRADALGLPLLEDLEQLPGLERGDLRLLRSMRSWRDINATSLRGRERRALDRLTHAGLLEVVPAGQRWVDGVGSHRHSELGHLVARAVGLELPIRSFADLQQELIRARVAQLERAARGADAVTAAIDLRLCRAQIDRLRALALYRLEIRADRCAFNKIGVTSRPLDERLVEIRADLAPHFDRIELGVAGHWTGRGSLELYLKRKLARYQVKLGSLTEYFDLSHVSPHSSGARTLQDLSRLTPR